MTGKLRRIQPLELPGIKPADISGEKPVLRWVEPTTLYVDETYQRDLSRKSIELIRTMAECFAWNRMKPPVVVQAEGKLHVIDGQHTAITAATIGLKLLPIFVVAAASVADRARAFVGHNTDRIVVAPINIHKALLGAGDEAAVDVDNVCRRSGVRIRWINQGGTVDAGDTMVVGGIYSLVRRRGVRAARVVLECLVKAKRAPITAGEIKACEHILHSVRTEIEPDMLATAIRINGDKGVAKALAKARLDRAPAWRAIADGWIRQIDREGA